MRTCPKCNKEVRVTADACWNCGHNLAPEAERPDGSAFASTDWLGELGAALGMLRAWEQDADEESAPVFCAQVRWLQKVITKRMNTERRRSPSAKLCERGEGA
jgi:hypothetical protein